MPQGGEHYVPQLALAEREESLQRGEEAFEDWEIAKSNIRTQLP
jgi:hypothetical protein